MAHWMIGGDLQFASPQYLRGDESNRMPTLPGYSVINLHTRYQLNEHLDFYAHIANLINHKYSTFGELGDPTGIGAPGVPVDADTNDPRVDNRFLSPAPPFGAFPGLRFRF